MSVVHLAHRISKSPFSVERIYAINKDKKKEERVGEGEERQSRDLGDSEESFLWNDRKIVPHTIVGQSMSD